METYYIKLYPALLPYDATIMGPDVHCDVFQAVY